MNYWYNLQISFSKESRKCQYSEDGEKGKMPGGGGGWGAIRGHFGIQTRYTDRKNSIGSLHRQN